MSKVVYCALNRPWMVQMDCEDLSVEAEVVTVNH